MKWFYNLALYLTSFFLGIIAWFNPKIRRFVSGRQHTYELLQSKLAPGDKIIWIHAASLGEYEQGLPVILRLKRHFRQHRILVTFFSPSGYEVKKGSKEADCITYLPLDTHSNVTRFLDLVQPQLAIFVKYEVWPNYFSELNKRGIPLLLISARFIKTQVFFKWYGGFLRNALRSPTHIFVQDKSSLQLLQTIGIKQGSVSGDTRFDRVSEILERDNSLPFMESFKAGGLCLVGGSTWPEDEALLIPYINNSPDTLKFVLAPHDIKEDHIQKLRNAISKNVVLHSELNGRGVEGIQVLVIDTIGLLTRIYSYADIAYVGGGFATGLHNTLEPAAFGVPVVIGPNYGGFKEAVDLVSRQGILVVTRDSELQDTLNRLVADESYRANTGAVNAAYVQENLGATNKILDYINALLQPD